MKRHRVFFVIVFITFFASACSQMPPSQQNRGVYSAQRASMYSFQYQNSRNSSIPRISPARRQIVSITKSTLGTPYKWGGNTRSGFDCSGLVKYVHKQALGINIPRTTAQQRDTSRTITYAQLQPGDMLFFKTSAKTNHVGVYIGNREFIHAPSSGKTVTVASMDSLYWYKRFVKFGTYF